MNCDKIIHNTCVGGRRPTWGFWKLHVTCRDIKRGKDWLVKWLTGILMFTYPLKIIVWARLSNIRTHKTSLTNYINDSFCFLSIELHPSMWGDLGIESLCTNYATGWFLSFLPDPILLKRSLAKYSSSFAWYYRGIRFSGFKKGKQKNNSRKHVVCMY